MLYYGTYRLNASVATTTNSVVGCTKISDGASPSQWLDSLRLQVRLWFEIFPFCFIHTQLFSIFNYPYFTFTFSGIILSATFDANVHVIQSDTTNLLLNNFKLNIDIGSDLPTFRLESTMTFSEPHTSTSPIILRGNFLFLFLKTFLTYSFKVGFHWRKALYTWEKKKKITKVMGSYHNKVSYKSKDILHSNKYHVILLN